MINLRGLFGRFTTDTSTNSTVSVSNTLAVVLLPSNPNRLGGRIVNAAGTLYVQFGPNASDINYAVKLTLGGECSIPIEYTGVITARKASGTTAVYVTTFS
jgi:hypothetical protein